MKMPLRRVEEVYRRAGAGEYPYPLLNINRKCWQNCKVTKIQVESFAKSKIILKEGMSEKEAVKLIKSLTENKNRFKNKRHTPKWIKHLCKKHGRKRTRILIKKHQNNA